MMRARVLLAHTAAVAATAAAGSAATRSASRTYRRLDKPPWQPPGEAFGIVWPALYGLLAYSGSEVWQHADATQRRQWERAYAANLVLNASWTWTFFRSGRVAFAALHAALLEASTLDLVRRARQVSPAAAAALVPYAAWSGFAFVLNTDIAHRNRA